MIETFQVGRLYGRGSDAVGLRDLSLSVPAGQVVAVLGHNGAGKTTLVRGLTTLLRFDRGDARVAGFDVRTQPHKVREHTAIVGQGVAVDDELSARQNLELFARLRGLRRQAARARTSELVREFGLDGHENRPVAGFSGGMRRRLDIAASLIVRPEVIFVDEPTTGLDPSARQDVWRLLRALKADGTTVLLTTQYLEEADALADRIVLLAHGRKIAEGTSDDLKDRLGQSRIHLRFRPSDMAAAVPALTSFDPSVRLDGDMSALLPAPRPESLAECIRTLADQGLFAIEASLRKPSLDDVFLTLTEETRSEDGKS